LFRCRETPHSDVLSQNTARPTCDLAASCTLLAGLNGHVDRRSGEVEPFSQLALDEPPVRRLERPAREKHEPRRSHPRLGREQDLRLLATADGRRRRCNYITEKRVELRGRHPRLPTRQRLLQRGRQPVHTAS